jgi:hypothetical protein
MVGNLEEVVRACRGTNELGIVGAREGEVDGRGVCVKNDGGTLVTPDLTRPWTPAHNSWKSNRANASSSS